MNPAAAILVAALIAAPPSGRPPLAPLARYAPRVYDLAFDVTVTTLWQVDARYQQSFELRDAPIVMPLIFQGPYSWIRADSLRARLWLEGREDPAAPGRARLDAGHPFSTKMAVIPIEAFSGKTLRWQLGYRVQSWSSRLNSEAEAAAIPWPQEWPEEVRDGLRPQRFIESDDPIFAAAVREASGGRLRMVPPYVAAKELVRYCIAHIRVTGDGVLRGNLGVVHGLELAGARQAASAGIGTPHDLVCACVALLRAAGIPARAVVGVEDEDDDEQDDGGRRQGPRFVSWAEFYLPQAGWVPFDPVEMRDYGIRTRDVRQPWPEFGTMDDLNRRIPLGYHFSPPGAVQAPQEPAVWGWDPRPRGAPYARQQIRLTVISRGRGSDD